MRFLAAVAFTANLFAGTGVAMANSCEAVPPPVALYLKAHPDEKLLSLFALAASEQEVWRKRYPLDCPGVATVHLRGAMAARSYAVALLSGSSQQVSEKLILLDGIGNKTSEEPLIGAVTVTSSHVVLRFKPGSYSSRDGKTVQVSSDSVVYGDLGNSMTQFYMQGDKVQSFQPVFK